jgi:hypothetical protein
VRVLVVVNFENEKLGNLFKTKLTLVFRNSLEIDGLKFDLLEENFPPDIHRDPKSKIDHSPRSS